MKGESARPLLLPQNRHLRHVQGVYLRNLTLKRPRGQTIDDNAINKSPQKLEALRSSPQLHHALSSGNLRPSKPRRVSTNWIGAATPDFRQEKLEDVISSRSPDSFFSLHCAGQEDPIYISEVVEKAMNPTFRFFDLAAYGPATTRLDTFTVKIWARRTQEFALLVEVVVNLRALNFIGTLENHPFPPNCILFQLVDGIYTLDMTLRQSRPRPAHSLPTSSYNALMRLSNLDESIQDALATREELANQINSILAQAFVDEAPQAQEAATLASKYVAAERRVLKQSTRRRAELKASIAARRSAMKAGLEIQEAAKLDVSNAEPQLRSCLDTLQDTTAQIHGQRRRICEELSIIFLIEPTSQPLLFTICGLELPNTSFEDTDDAVVSAALGYVARVVDLLQYYLFAPLPYPVTPQGSRTTIRDPVSQLPDTQRIFPLYTRATARFRFDYGVFLLNKNIEALAASQGLKVLDIRQTLPNLKYLLFVASAGSEDLPSRKAGGIRGLLGGNPGAAYLSGRGTPTALSRRGSYDSTRADGGQGDALRRALEIGLGNGTGNGNGPAHGRGGGNEPMNLNRKQHLPNANSQDEDNHYHGDNNEAHRRQDDMPDFDDAFTLPFALDHTHSLRTRGLRENVMR